MSDHREGLSLADAARRTDLAIVARPASPPHRFEEINIAPGGKAPSEKYPAFRKILYRWLIEEVLWGLEGIDRPKAGSTIEVESASWGYDLTVHRKRYLDGVNKITIHEGYDPSAPPDGDPRQILLLKRQEKGWSFVCDISAEPLRARATVKRLLDSRKGENGGSPLLPS